MEIQGTYLVEFCIEKQRPYAIDSDGIERTVYWVASEALTQECVDDKSRLALSQAVANKFGLFAAPEKPLDICRLFNAMSIDHACRFIDTSKKHSLNEDAHIAMQKTIEQTLGRGQVEVTHSLLEWATEQNLPLNVEVSTSIIKAAQKLKGATGERKKSADESLLKILSFADSDNNQFMWDSGKKLAGRTVSGWLEHAELVQSCGYAQRNCPSMKAILVASQKAHSDSNTQYEGVASLRETL